VTAEVRAGQRGGDTYRADVVIGADGHRSVVRAVVAPDKPEARAPSSGCTC
jgi:2-polyprenyl-6-methoxyphenol hydroxylase-like FAD-dependent oxidoreductase